MENRDRADRDFEIKKLLHFILRGTNSKLYDLAFPNIEVDDPDVIPGHTYGVEDLEGLEKLLSGIGLTKSRTMADPGKSWTEWG
ncbi:MAG TPA: hypothetical protein VIY48_11885 [Candidatus Paceibacterota bacterium]